MPPELPTEGSAEPSLAEGDEKKKQQRRGRRKSKLEDMFPAYLQAGSRLPTAGEGRVCAHRASRNHFSRRLPPAGSLLWEGTAGPEPEDPFCSWGGPAKPRSGNSEAPGGWRSREEGAHCPAQRSVDGEDTFWGVWPTFLPRCRWQRCLGQGWSTKGGSRAHCGRQVSLPSDWSGTVAHRRRWS